MQCKEAHKLLDGYVDGELDIIRNLEMERHVHDCSLCSEDYKTQQELRNAIKANLPYFNAPEALQERIATSVRKAARTESAARFFRNQWMSIAAPLAAAAIVVLAFFPLLKRPSADEVLTREVLASHLRSLMADHLSDVASSDQHTVKPWFNGKLDFSPPVLDVANEGFPLVGGRLDYVNNRPVAALVYAHRKHFINLFVWPSGSANNGGTETTIRQGYNILHWTKAGMTFWVVSDLNKTELQDFARRIHDQS